MHTLNVSRAILVCVASLLLSCSGSTMTKPPEPTVGTCTEHVERARRDQPGMPPADVQCTTPHGGEVWRVLKLPPPWDREEEPRPAPGSPVEQDLARLAGEHCSEAGWRSYANLRVSRPAPAGERSPPAALRNRWYYAPAEDWARGARWIRCELAIAWDEPGHVGARWKGDLATVLAGPAGRLTVNSDCRSTTGPDGDGVDVPCDEPHDAEVVSAYRSRADSAPSASPQVWRDTCAQDAREHLGVSAATDGSPNFEHVASARTEPTRPEDPATQARVSCVLSFQRRGTAGAAMTLGSARGIGPGDPQAVP